jgi:diadenylate cyclase
LNPFFTWPPDWGALIQALTEIALLWLVVYAILRFLQGTRGFGVLRGLFFWIIITAIVVVLVIQKFNLYRIEYLMGREVLLVFLFLAVLFQPEIRRLLLRLGEAPIMQWMFRGSASIVPEIVEAAFTLSERRIGALMVIEREVGLSTLLEGATLMDSEVSSSLLVTIFWPGSPLHDGAVLIRGNRVAGAGCLLPLTELPGIAKSLGTRHRAAIGVTEESDALSIVVSEETQAVSLAYRGQLRTGLDKEALRSILESHLIETVSSLPGATES